MELCHLVLSVDTSILYCACDECHSRIIRSRLGVSLCILDLEIGTRLLESVLHETSNTGGG
jgi:hypothetical protein